MSGFVTSLVHGKHVRRVHHAYKQEQRDLIHAVLLIEVLPSIPSLIWTEQLSTHSIVSTA